MCVCVYWVRKEKHLRKENVFGNQTMYHLHTAGCMSDTGLPLWATIALLLNGCCLTGSHIKATDPFAWCEPLGGEKGNSFQKHEEKRKKSPKSVGPSGTRMCPLQQRRLEDARRNFFSMKKQKRLSLSLSLNLGLHLLAHHLHWAQQLTQGAARGQLRLKKCIFSGSIGSRSSCEEFIYLLYTHRFNRTRCLSLKQFICKINLICTLYKTSVSVHGWGVWIHSCSGSVLTYWCAAALCARRTSGRRWSWLAPLALPHLLPSHSGQWNYSREQFLVNFLCARGY